MRRDLALMAVIWGVVTALVWVFAALMNPFPTVGAHEAEFSDHAFRVMTYMGAPVFGLVVAVLVYSVLRFRVHGDPTSDGPALRGAGSVPRVWVVVTSLFAVVVMIYPGLTGLAEIRSDKSADLVVTMTGQRWSWVAAYPDAGVEVPGSETLVLPLGKRVRFDVTAREGDVLHSFWVPAFRMKIDAVPGQIDRVYITPTALGNGDDDVAYRVQCAELCGLLHARMAMKVRVVQPAEFDQWLAQRQQQAKAGS